MGVLRVEVLPMFRVIERPQPGQMYLLPLPLRFPVSQPFIYQLLRALVDLPIDLDDLHALPLRTMNLPPHRLVVLLRLDLRGVKSLFRNSTDGAPSQLMRQNAFTGLTHTRPNRLESLLVLDVMKIRSDDLRRLFGIAQRVSKRDCKLVLFDVTDRRPRFGIPPHGPEWIEPACVRCITVCGDKL